MLINLKLSKHHLQTIIKVIIAANILLLTGTAIMHTMSSQLPHRVFVFLRESDLSSENVFAAWYSSMLLFISAIISIMCFVLDRQRAKGATDRMVDFGWLGYVFVFATLSFDELGSIHEHIGNFNNVEKLGGSMIGGKESGWVLFYVFVGLVSTFMILFSFIRLRKARMASIFLLAGLLLFLSVPFQENIEINAMRAAVDKEIWKRPAYFLLLEEGSEIFGSLFFFLAMTSYARFASRQIHLDATNDIVLKQEADTTLVMRLLVFFVLSFGIGLFVIKILFGDVRGDLQTGVPKNWITAATAFLISVYCLVLFNQQKVRRDYLLFSVFCICLSIYYGSDRFAYNFWSEYSKPRLMLRSLIALFGVVSYIAVLVNLKTKTAKLSAIASLLIIITGVFVRRPYSAEVTFIGLCVLILFSFSEYLKAQARRT